MEGAVLFTAFCYIPTRGRPHVAQELGCIWKHFAAAVGRAQREGGSLPSPNPPPPLNKIGMRNRIQRRKEQANNRTEGGALLPIHFYTKGESECGRETQTAVERAVCPRRPSGSQGGSRDLVKHSFHLSKWHSQFMLLTLLVNFAL